MVTPNVINAAQLMDKLSINVAVCSHTHRSIDVGFRRRCVVFRPQTRIIKASRPQIHRFRVHMSAVQESSSYLQAALLETADYSFYQRMKESEISEEFLWENRLAPLLNYLPSHEVRRVREALSLAFDAHSEQYRKSGEPFITHPVEVTRILAQLQMDYESLAAGLLHDTVEDCGETVGLEEIGFHFGSAVQRIVEGETKFSKLPTHHPERAAENSSSSPSQDHFEGKSSCSTPNTPSASPTTNMNQQQDSKAQDLQFLFLAMTEEVRIIVVKLADRLHNMRTMESMPPGKQRRIAAETLSVFAPLARLLGLYTIKEELEELSFKYAMPQQYAVMKKTIDRLWEQQRPSVEAAASELNRRLSEDPYLATRLVHLDVDVTKKALYGAWRKLQESGKSVRDISEIAQLRVVLHPSTSSSSSSPERLNNGTNNNGSYGNTTTTTTNNNNNNNNNGAAQRTGTADRQLCYHVMGLVHSFWAPIPGSMKDYIATPKPNNYQSLHTTVVPTGLAVALPPSPTTTANGRVGRNPGSHGRSSMTAALFPIEIQIRTKEMERLAQYGIAIESWSCADYARSPNGSSSSSSINTSTNQSGAVSLAMTSSLEDNNDNTNDITNDMNQDNIDKDVTLTKSTNNNGQSILQIPLTIASELLSHNLKWNKTPENGSKDNDTKHPSPPSTANTATLTTKLDSQIMSRRINWLNSIRQWQEEFVGTLTAQEFVACVTDDLLGQGVFVFTPSGQVMRLPKGSTAIDFAYHIHTDVGNTMVAARVNGKVVNAEYELANAEVVEVITYKGPINATIIKRHQKWLEAARTKTARHKIAKFLREHAALAASAGLIVPGDTALGRSQRGLEMQRLGGSGMLPFDPEATQTIWLLLRSEDRQGLLADIAHAISSNGHNIRSYSGSVDRDANLFAMEYELEGPAEALRGLCDDLSLIPSVQGWHVGCALPDWQRYPRRI